MMMDDGDKTKDQAAGLSVEALDDAMEEVVMTLDLMVQATGFVLQRSPDPIERARAAAIQQQAEAMLIAAEERPAKPRHPERRGDPRTMH